MDRVGGDFRSWKALCDDARAYEDVLIVMEGEADARKIEEMKAKAGAG